MYNPVIAASNPPPHCFFAVVNQRLRRIHSCSSQSSVVGRAADLLIFCLASRSCFIAPHLVHAIRWAKRVYDPVIASRRILRRPHRIIIVCNKMNGCRRNVHLLALSCYRYRPNNVVCRYVPTYLLARLEDPTLAIVWLVHYIVKMYQNYC